MLFNYRHLRERKINGESTEFFWTNYTCLQREIQHSTLLALCYVHLSKYVHDLFAIAQKQFFRTFRSKNEINRRRITCYDFEQWIQLSKRVMASWRRKRGRSHSRSAPPVLKIPRKIKKLKQWSIDSMTAAVLSAVVVQQFKLFWLRYMYSSSSLRHYLRLTTGERSHRCEDELDASINVCGVSYSTFEDDQQQCTGDLRKC